MFFRWAQHQSKRLDLIGEILYNSSTKIKTVRHKSRSMAPRIPSNCRVTVKPSLSYRVGDVVAARVPKSKQLRLLRVVASPGTDMIDDGEPPKEMKLRRGDYWLEADRDVSDDLVDSRTFGPVSSRDIVGRAYNMEFGGQLVTVMHNSEKTVEEDSRNAWTLPYLVRNVPELFRLWNTSAEPEWVQEQLRLRVRCKVLSEPASVEETVPRDNVLVPNM